MQVPGYPTWEIGGELYPGEKSIEALEVIVEETLHPSSSVEVASSSSTASP